MVIVVIHNHHCYSYHCSFHYNCYCLKRFLRHALKVEHKKVTPCDFCWYFSNACRFVHEIFAQLVNNEIFTLSLRFVKLYLKMTKLCCCNQDNPHFSAFECHAELAASELSRVHWNFWDLNPLGLSHLDYHVWGAMLEKYYKLQPKPKATDELKVTLQTTWEVLPQEHVNKVLTNCTKCLTATAYMVVGCRWWSPW